jgi:L-ascorbate 6-phosphate lactonase
LAYNATGSKPDSEDGGFHHVRVAEAIKATRVEPHSVAIFWLGQAGFVLKGPSGEVVYIDPYLTNAGENLRNLRRIMPEIMAPEEVEADLLITTHHHLDHLDPEAVPIIAKQKTGLVFAGPPACAEVFRSLSVPEERIWTLSPGDQRRLGSVELLAVDADHAEQAPDAIGVIVNFDGIRIYHTGDTCLRPDIVQPIASLSIDVVIPCINGTSGNMNAEEAAQVVDMLRARVAMPCHHWLFVRQGGDPRAFVEHCAKLSPETQVVNLTQGASFIYHK